MNTDQKILESSQEDQSEDQSRKNCSKVFLVFVDEVEKLGQSEEKLRAVINFMKEALSQAGNPRFKDFWDGRRMALSLFKENLNPLVRTQFWNDYMEISAEARRLKEILDEQSSFASEQIELAIASLEQEMENYHILLEQLPFVSIPELRESFGEQRSLYLNIQKELDLLNNFASKINSLRKETLKTEMRIRQKNKFFSRLSSAGDLIFPKRKDLIKQISDVFFEDVQKFTSIHFGDFSSANVPIYELREEIKSLQDVAKIFTLNTHCFTQTRLQLSEAWDKLKNFEKERKKEQVQKRAVSRENCDALFQRVEQLALYCQDPSAQMNEMNKQADDIVQEMKTAELSREDIRALREALYKAKAPLTERIQNQEKKEKTQQQQQQVQRDKILILRKDVEALLQDDDDLELDAFITIKDMKFSEIEKLSLTKPEKLIFDRLFKQIRDLIADKKEKVLLNRSEDDIQSLENLRSICLERRERRAEIKNQIESYRKALGTSGFDFEKAMQLRELMDDEKLQLERVNQAILEIEEKITEIEG